MLLEFIRWTIDPDIISIGPLTFRWYGLLWAIGFIVGYYIILKIYDRDQIPEEQAEKVFLYMLIGTVIGARLGHCFFYGFSYYTAHPIEILKIWEGGLSSHGGACGILIAMWLYSKKVVHKSFIWAMDRIVMPVAICGACIRLGNLMNHEIYGHATDVPWAFEFITNIRFWQAGAEPVFSAPSHPTQIYESLYCIFTFVLTMFLYWRTNARKFEGLLFGIFLELVFVTRFLLEFIKNDQETFEENMVINMGQLLSIPLIIWGIYLLYKSISQMKKSREYLKLTKE